MNLSDSGKVAKGLCNSDVHKRTIVLIHSYVPNSDYGQ